MMPYGGEDFYALSKRLKTAGNGGLRRELHKAMRVAAKPLIPKVRAAAMRDLPKSGGLNQRIAKKPYRAQTRTGVLTAGVRITGGQVDPRINNEGRVAHPVFGRQGKPVNGGRNVVVQNVPQAKGYFDDTISHSAGEVRDDIADVLGDYLRRI